MPERLPWQERERLVDRAAADYMAGRIDSAEWRRISREHGPDYEAAARALANRRIRRRLTGPCARLWRWLMGRGER